MRWTSFTRSMKKTLVLLGAALALIASGFTSSVTPVEARSHHHYRHHRYWQQRPYYRSHRSYRWQRPYYRSHRSYRRYRY